MAQMSVWVTEEQKKYIDEEAYKRSKPGKRVSASNIIQEILEEKMRTKENEKE